MFFLPSVTPDLLPTPDQIVETLRNLAGFAALVTAGINFAKWRGWVNDGNAPTVAFVCNLLGYIGVTFLYLFGVIDLLPAIDSDLGGVATILNAIISIFVLQGVEKVAHRAISGVRYIGHSNSNPNAQDFRA